MNKQRFIELLRTPENHQGSDVSAVESLMEQYPYCQVAHVLMAKITHDAGSMNATKSARRAALYTSDRSKLKALLDKKPTPLVDKPSTVVTELPKIIHTPVEAVDKIVPTTEVEKIEPIIDSTPIQEVPATAQQKAETNVDAFIQSLQERLEQLSALKAKAAGKEEHPEIVDEVIANNLPDIVQETTIVSEPTSEVKDTSEKTEEAKPTVSEAKPEDKRKQIPQLPGFNINTGNASNDVLDMILGFDNRVKDYFDLESMTNAAGEKIEVNEEDKVDVTPSASTDYHIPFTIKDWTIENSRLEEDSTNLLLNYLDYLKEERQKKKRPDKKREQKLIDKFIQEDPSIPPMRNSGSLPQVSDEQGYDEEDALDLTFATETMGKILAQQGKIKEAIQVYEALRLKYPEKSAYFADLIKKLS
ncbi:MAG: hypothetical protein U0U66_05320 [Cytophagaceae bacterium]